MAAFAGSMVKCRVLSAKNYGKLSRDENGRCPLFRMAEEGDKPLPLNLIHYKEITVLGSYGCTLGSTKEAMRLISDGSIKVKDMITNRIGLEEVEEALKMVRDLKGLSICLNY